ncbi:MAG: hypothetical protein HOO99_04110 [Hyphomicrobiaceae bacterium]|nr:hypothetical protein [Hyphomicrobiaceae bacterium]
MSFDHASKELAKAAGVPELSGLGVIHDAAIARIALFEELARRSLVFVGTKFSHHDDEQKLKSDIETALSKPGTIKCPRCGGAGGGVAFINRGPDISKHSVENRDCLVCAGTGSVTDEQMKRIEIGRAMRAERITLSQSLLTASIALGCTPAELSRWETTGEPISEQRARKVST